MSRTYSLLWCSLIVSASGLGPLVAPSFAEVKPGDMITAQNVWPGFRSRTTT